MSEKKTILNLQALRAVAALLVLLSHVMILEQKYAPADALLPRMFFFGGSGVDLFFVISGFIMVSVTRGYSPSTAASGSFLYKRVSRIYPLYWIYSAAVLVVYFFAPNLVNAVQNNQVNIFSSFLLLPDTLMPLINVGWSLRHEMYFYLVFGLFLVFVHERTLPLAVVCWSFIVLVGWFTLGERNATFSLIFHPYTFEFILGTFVAFACNRRYLKLLIPAMIVGGAMFAIPFVFFAWSEQIALMVFEHPWWRLFFFGLPGALIVYGCVGLEMAGRWVAPRWLIAIGDASYSLYLTHVLVASVLGRVWVKLAFSGTLAQMVFLAMMFGGCIAWGLISYRCIEKPLLEKSRHLRQFWKARQTSSNV